MRLWAITMEYWSPHSRPITSPRCRRVTAANQIPQDQLLIGFAETGRVSYQDSALHNVPEGFKLKKESHFPRCWWISSVSSNFWVNQGAKMLRKQSWATHSWRWCCLMCVLCVQLCPSSTWTHTGQLLSVAVLKCLPWPCADCRYAARETLWRRSGASPLGPRRECDRVHTEKDADLSFIRSYSKRVKNS